MSGVVKGRLSSNANGSSFHFWSSNEVDSCVSLVWGTSVHPRTILLQPCHWRFSTVLLPLRDAEKATRESGELTAPRGHCSRGSAVVNRPSGQRVDSVNMCVLSWCDYISAAAPTQESISDRV